MKRLHSSAFGSAVAFLTAAAGFTALIQPQSVAAAPLTAAAVEDAVVGSWSGAIELPGHKLSVQIRLEEKNGALTGSVTIPEQNAKNLELEKLSRDGVRVKFSIKGIPGNPTFDGVLAQNGQSLGGDFSQAGQKFPFTLTRPAASDPAKTLDGFDEWVNKTMMDWEVPGLGVAIVRDGKTLLAKGYGLRDREAKAPATQDTLFAIGSSTKAFTTFVMGVLVDEGKMQWDTPVVNYMPTFKLANGEVGRMLTPLDLVTHRSGLPRHDASWYNSTATRQELVERLAFLPANKALRETWQYNNLMFVSAGVLTERLTGQSWEANVKNRILDPLGMARTNFSVTESQRDADFAFPYDKREKEGNEEVQRIPFRDLSIVGPAGSINSSASEMASWVTVQLSGNSPSGTRVISDDVLRRLHTPAMTMPSDPTSPEVIAVGYAPGWFVDVYRGYTRIHHGGNIDGFSALVFLFPAQNFGGVVLTNRNASPVPGLVAREISDRFLNLEREDWSGRALAKQSVAESAGKEGKAKRDLARKPGTKPSHELSEYVGEYENAGYGIARIFLKDDKLHGEYNRMIAPLEHWHYDAFVFGKAEDPTLEDSKLLFWTNLEGDICAFEISLEPSVSPTVFTRKPDVQLKDPAYLQRFVGQYDLKTQIVTITLQGSALRATLPGQPTYDLVPSRDNTFDLKGLSGFRIRFTVDGLDKASAATFFQPNGVFEAKRKE